MEYSERSNSSCNRAGDDGRYDETDCIGLLDFEKCNRLYFCYAIDFWLSRICSVLYVPIDKAPTMLHRYALYDKVTCRA